MKLMYVTYIVDSEMDMDGMDYGDQEGMMMMDDGEGG